MFFQNDYEIKLNQEQLFRDLAREAQTDHLLDELHPRRPNMLYQSARVTIRAIGRLFLGIGKYLERAGEPALTPGAPR